MKLKKEFKKKVQGHNDIMIYEYMAILTTLPMVLYMISFTTIADMEVFFLMSILTFFWILKEVGT